MLIVSKSLAQQLTCLITSQEFPGSISGINAGVFSEGLGWGKAYPISCKPLGSYLLKIEDLISKLTLNRIEGA